MAVRADRWAQIAASGDDGRKGDGCPSRDIFAVDISGISRIRNG
jgi:hypothetical protein